MCSHNDSRLSRRRIRLLEIENLGKSSILWHYFYSYGPKPTSPAGIGWLNTPGPTQHSGVSMDAIEQLLTSISGHPQMVNLG